MIITLSKNMFNIKDLDDIWNMKYQRFQHRYRQKRELSDVKTTNIGTITIYNKKAIENDSKGTLSKFE